MTLALRRRGAHGDGLLTTAMEAVPDGPAGLPLAYLTEMFMLILRD